MARPVDHRQLLAKYIRHVGEQLGSTCTDPRELAEAGFSLAEAEELYVLEAEGAEAT